MKKNTSIRLPQFEDKFYSGSESRLKSDLSHYFQQAQQDQPANLPASNPQILIVPHAGYPYSGQVAAAGFNQLPASGFSRIILLGSSHQKFLKKAAVFQGKGWETPLGIVAVDQEAVNTLLAQPGFTANNEAHQSEHSLEVQLPFLQHRLKSDFQIVPILLGQLENSKLTEVVAGIKKIWDENSVLIISSDLSHYPHYELANQVDQETIQSILSGDPQLFKQVASQIMPDQSVQTRACGAQAIEAGLHLAQSWSGVKIKLISYANSGDVSGNKQRVVGYAALGFYSDHN